MSKSYIVETDDETQLIVEIGVNSTGAALIATNPVSFLTPYTEPDVEQIRKDAFKNGYDAACKDIDVKSKINAAYRKGLEDAWEAARKIASIPTTELHTMFDKEVYYDTVFRDCTAPEALSKLATYEEQKKQEDAEFRVGDEFITKNNKDLGVIIGANAKRVLVLWKDDSDIFHENNREFTTKWAKERFAKTGRHFPEIAEVFKKMQEEKE